MRNIIPAAAWAVLALAGCAHVAAPGPGVQEMAAARMKQELPAARSDRTADATRVRELLAAPLTGESAVTVALLNNPAVRAALAGLGVAEAELAQEGRLRNPGFSIARLRQGGEREIERHFTLDIAGLVTMPWRLAIAREEFAGLQLVAARDIVAAADEARRAWIEAVAAQERLVYAGRVSDAAQAGSELATQMLRAGNWSRLTQSREQLSHAEAATQLARAEHDALAARERLVRALGLQGEQLAFTLPESLPEPPAAPRALEDSEARAMANRLDVLEARRETESLARSLGLTRATGFVNILELGYERTSSNAAPRKTGYEITLELPIFDSGQARVARAEARYRQRLEQAAGTAIAARSEVREEHSAYTRRHAIARRYRDEIVPLRAGIVQESLLRYNGMLESVWHLLAEAREQSSAVMASIEATRDFWLADARLDTVLLTGPAERSTR